MIPVKVERVLLEDHTILITLDPADLIQRLAHELRAKHGLMALLRQLPADHPEHRRAKRELIDALADTFQVALSPAEAEELSVDVASAARAAVPCETSGCFNLANSDYCGPCLDGGAGEVRRAG
jgi:hypothetical protein